LVANAPAPAAENESGRRRILRRTAVTLFLLVLVGSILAFFVGLLIGELPVFIAGSAGFVGCGLIADVVGALRIGEPDEDPAQLRSRRRLAVAEVLLITGWVVLAFVAWFDRPLVLGTAWAVGVVVIVVVFRELRHASGIVDPEPETLQDAPPADFSPEQAEHFWRERNRRLLWATLMLFDVAAYGGALLAGVLIGGDSAVAALGVSALLLVPITLVAWRLHKWLDIPFGAIPPRPEPEETAVPQEVEYRVGLVNAALLPLAVAFVSIMLGAIAISEGRKGPEPAISSAAALLVAAATVLAVASAIAIFVRSRRMRLEVGPDGLRSVNFWSSRAVRWAEIERIEAASSPGLTAVMTIASALAEQEAPGARALDVRLKDGGAVRVGVRNFADPHRSAGFQRILVALRREAAAHEVPIRF
jgi:hypothetical protein